MTQNRYYSSVAQAASLTAGVSSSAGSMTVSGTTGFPASVPYTLVLDSGTANQEIVTVTAAAGTTLTVTRGEDGSTAVAHDAGATVVHSHSARDFAEPQAHIAATSGVHGVTGALVGTANAQALTNKDLTSGTNMFPASLATDAELLAHTSQTTGVHGTTGHVVGATDIQALTNKDLTAGTNTFPASLATTSGVTSSVNSAVATHAALTATHGVTGAVVGTTDAQTLTNKTLTSPTITGGTQASPTLTSPTLNAPVLGSPDTTVGVTAAAGWSLASSTFVKYGSLVQFHAVFTRTGSAISVNSSGNIPNQAVATFNAGYTPACQTNAVSGSVGRLCAFDMSTSTIYLAATSPSVTIATSDQVSVGGLYIAG